MKKKVKARKIAGKSNKRKKKPSFPDAVKAFMLVGGIVALSALISCAVILIHSSVNRENIDISQDETQPVQTTILPQSVIEEPQAEISVVIEENVVSARPSVTQNAVVQPPPAERTVSSSLIPPAQRPSVDKGTLVFVIDDAGNNLRELEPFLRIPGPLTIAVLPGLPYSEEAARRIRAAGKEVILHQPMEAIGGQNPGPGAIYSGMSPDEIRAILARNVAQIGPVTGINNHQGSKVTMDREAMAVILAFCAENNLYFLDSRTTAETVVPSVARNMEMRIVERNIFIDNEQSKDAMLRYISSGLLRAQRTGTAVMIGHTWSPALAPLLAEQFPLLIEQGYTIKTASDIIKNR
jgi:hypothetical protein